VLLPHTGKAVAGVCPNVVQVWARRLRLTVVSSKTRKTTSSFLTVIGLFSIIQDGKIIIGVAPFPRIPFRDNVSKNGKRVSIIKLQLFDYQI
jgi:hypothetical protein